MLRIILLVGIILITGCGPKNLTEATTVLYEGGMLGNKEFTYQSAASIAANCIMVKECMGLANEDYPLPDIKGMEGGNAVACGTNPDGTPTLKLGCYEPGLITVPQGADLEIISHECVHHWLYESTGMQMHTTALNFSLHVGAGLN